MTMTASRSKSVEINEGAAAASGGLPLEDVAEYIEDMVREMEGLARGPQFERLRDLLRLAREEAGRTARR